MIYLFYFIILLFLLLVEKSSKKKIFWRIVIPSVYVLLIGLRSPKVGMDSQDYADYYSAGYDDGYLEIGYEWLSRLLFNNGFTYTGLFLVVAFITVFFITLSIINKKGNDYSVSALLLYTLTYGFLINGMRQGISCAIFLYSAKFILEKKPIPYVISIIIASLFHTSALILLPFYFFRYLSLPSLIYLVIYLVSYAGVFFDISQYFPETFILGSKDYTKYIDKMTLEDPSLLGALVYRSIQIVILVLMLFNRKSLSSTLFNLAFMGFILSNIGFHFFIIGRITVYFSWFPYLLYGLLLDKSSKHLFNSREFTVFIVVVIHSVLLIHSIVSPANMQLPYLFYWE